ncbi:lytic transglycosylase domain-containing protein [Azospirillum halopraeferens]|uniref:lytic transglycosylase domain-containing protein n=1 Tax=Azospirillum halopraeferens TaxID=34010 RepID=UPI001FE0378D|nr:lytic transglycosylase domain-containing protein [Azospirillum halopraeferens]
MTRLRPHLLRALCAAVALVAVAVPGGSFGTARAALVIHAPDGRPVIPHGVDTPERPLVLVPDDAEARSVQLSAEDAYRYRRIFALQEQGRWDAADWEIARLGDTVLLGHVLRQRYLHPDRRAGYEELADWLKRYGDHPGAERLHALATRRAPAGTKPLRAPDDRSVRLTGSLERLGGFRPDPSPGPDTTDPEDEAATTGAAQESVAVAPRSRTRQATRVPVSGRIEDLLRAGKPGAALALLGDDSFSRQLDPVEYDAARARIASALYYAGQVRESLSLAAASAARSGDVVTDAHWIAGLAAWRLGQPDRAARHFDAMAAAAPRSPWRLAAAAYWAARAHDRKDRDDEARRQLTLAARFPHTFYGLLARHVLGIEDPIRFHMPALTAGHLTELASVPAGRRAVALLQAGRNDAAEEELRRVDPRGNELMAEALVVLADRGRLPALALRVGNAVAGPDGAPYDAALFPIPHWEPRDGFSVDRALVYAVMRQESRFDPNTVSSAGATGLMQIMPATAVHVRDRNDDIDDAGRSALLDPTTNMELGQRYIAELLAMPDIGSNLVLVTAAYNAGPGHLLRWRKEMADVTDPLLFIESIPFGETRDYVKKVLANFWIYRERLGQVPASLGTVAAGGWPVYMPLDGAPTQVAQNAQD